MLYKKDLDIFRYITTYYKLKPKERNNFTKRNFL